MYCFLDAKCNENFATGKIKHLHMLEQALKVLGETSCYDAIFFSAIPLTLGIMIDF